jgi:hypothetical protein
MKPIRKRPSTTMLHHRGDSSSTCGHPRFSSKFFESFLFYCALYLIRFPKQKSSSTVVAFNSINIDMIVEKEKLQRFSFPPFIDRKMS